MFSESRCQFFFLVMGDVVCVEDKRIDYPNRSSWFLTQKNKICAQGKEGKDCFHGILVSFHDNDVVLR